MVGETRWVLVAGAAVLAVLAFTLPLHPPPARAQDPAPVQDPIVAAQQEAAAALEQMEAAYLSVVADRELVRTGALGELLASEATGAALDALLAIVRDGGSEEATAAAIHDTAGKLSAEGGLSDVTLPVVLEAMAALAAAGEEGASRELFSRAAQELFEHDDLTRTWDERYQTIPAVQRYRRSQRALSAARDAAREGGSASQEEPESDMVLVPRSTRAQVGPWTGWSHELDEKDNVRQRIVFRGVYVDRYEVTCARYLVFLLDTPDRRREELLPEGWTLKDGTPQIPAGSEKLPVTGVSFEQAAQFARWAGKRLPTEDEWEVIAAGAESEAREYPWGAGAEERSFVHRESGATGLAPVDAHPQDATPEGVRGLAGNAAELVASGADRKPLVRGKLPKDGRVTVRGGSFRAKASECTTSWRWVESGEKGHVHVGFRCVMEERDYRKQFGR